MEDKKNEPQPEKTPESREKAKQCIYGGECTECVPGGCAE